MISKVIDSVTFYCPRPNYKLTTLDASLSLAGLSLASKILLNHDPAKVLVDEDGLLWISDIPTTEIILKRIKEDPYWIANICKERNESFILVKSDLLDATNKLKAGSNSLRTLIEIFISLCKVQTIFLSFVYLPIIDELLVNQIADLASKYLEKIQVQQYIFSLMQPPTYFREVIRSGLIINETKVLSIPPTEKLFFLCGDLNLDLSPQELDAIIISRFPKHAMSNGLEDALEFSILRSIMPILFQIGQEDLFIGKAIIVALSHCIHEIAKIFLENIIISDIKHILNYKSEELIKLAQKME